MAQAASATAWRDHHASLRRAPNARTRSDCLPEGGAVAAGWVAARRRLVEYYLDSR